MRWVGPCRGWAEALSVLLKTTDLEVIAEGVETAGQLALLRLWACDGCRDTIFLRPCERRLFFRYYSRHG